MTTPIEHRRNAIEAGAAALWVLVAADDLGVEPWAEASEDNKRETRQCVEAVYNAIAPGLRRAFAEEAAQALRVQRDSLDTENSYGDAAQADALDWAAAKVREIGGIA